MYVRIGQNQSLTELSLVLPGHFRREVAHIIILSRGGINYHYPHTYATDLSGIDRIVQYIVVGLRSRCVRMLRICVRMRS